MKVPFTNNGETARHIGGKIIRPGDTRDVEESLLGPKKPTAEEPAADPIEEAAKAALAENAKDVIAKLPEYADEFLERLERLEGDAKAPRKTVLAEIEAERLERAKQRGSEGDDGDGDGDDDEDLEGFKESIRDMPDGELEDMRTLYAEDEEAEKYTGHVEAIDAEIKRRAEEAPAET